MIVGISVTYTIRNLSSEDSLLVAFVLGGTESQIVLPPRTSKSLVAESFPYHTQRLVDAGKLSISVPSETPPLELGSLVHGTPLYWMGQWRTGVQYPAGAVVYYASFNYVATYLHTSVDPPAPFVPPWDRLALLDSTTLYGVELASMADGQIIARDSGAVGGFAPTFVGDAHVSSLSPSKITGLTGLLDAKLSLAGGTMTGALTLAAAPTLGNHAATKTYADGKLSLAGGTMTGALTLSADPVDAGHAATKSYVDGKLGTGFLSLTGGTMSGALVLSGAPTIALHAATKAYVDLRLLRSGGTMTGDLTLAGAPTASLHAASKAYVDGFLPRTGGTMSGALTVQAPTASGHAASKNYVDTQVAAGRTFASKVSVPTGTIPTNPGDLVPLGYLTANALDALQKSGGTMTGPIVLSGAPTLSLHAATKAYVDAADALLVPKTGGTMSGALTGAHGLLPRSAGSAAPLTGELNLQPVADLAASPKTGLVYSSERGVPAFQGKTVALVGTQRYTDVNYTVLPGDGVVYANSGTAALVIGFGAPSTYPSSPVTVVKEGASPNAPVYIKIPGADGRNSLHVLSQNGESLTLFPGAAWTVTGKVNPGAAAFTVVLDAVTADGDDFIAALEVRDYVSRSQAFASVSDEGGGSIGFDLTDGAADWQVGDQFTVSNAPSAYVDDYAVESISGGKLVVTHAFTGSAAGQVNGFVRPLLTGQTRICGIRVTEAPDDPWTLASDVVISVESGDEVHPGGDASKIVRSAVDGTLDIRLVATAPRTLYLHVLSAGELHGRVNGGYDSAVSTTARYAANITAAASSGGDTVFTVPHSHGFEVGDVVTVSGAGSYNGPQTVTAVASGSVTLDVAYVGSVSSGTITSADSISLAVLDPDGFSAGQYIYVDGVTALGSSNVALLVAGVVYASNLVVARHPTFNSLLGLSGLAGVLPVVEVVFT